jgi:hypothetical protein
LSSVPGTPSTATPASSLPATAAAGTLSGPHVDVTPAAVLLIEVGASRRLTALAFDAAGNPSGGSATWTTNDPATVEIAADGTLTARALGSAQITASVDGVTSAPTLVVVATPAAGAILVSDEQIVGEPAVADADAGTFRVTLNGLSPRIGDILVGTGGKALGGRVAAVDGQTATMELVPPASWSRIST